MNTLSSAPFILYIMPSLKKVAALRRLIVQRPSSAWFPSPSSLSGYPRVSVATERWERQRLPMIL